MSEANEGLRKRRAPKCQGGAWFTDDRLVAAPGADDLGRR